MTREEAIEKLKRHKCYIDGENKCQWVTEGFGNCADCEIGVAIEALTAEPCEDAVSRKQALIEIKAIMRGEPMLLKSLHRKKWEEETAQYRECMEIIKALPSVQPIRPKEETCVCFSCRYGERRRYEGGAE